MAERTYATEEEVVAQANKALNKTLRDFIPEGEVSSVEEGLGKYGTKRKGHFGDLTERYIFGIKNNSRAEADFLEAGIELKTSPLKKNSRGEYVSKERLVFSMIDYTNVVNEEWSTSSFLKKNSRLLLMFYLYAKETDLLDYEFKFIHLLELLKDISAQDMEQIKRDWEFIVAKIRKGEAHLLSESDTCYLSACTKASNSRVFRDQPRGTRIPAKPRAFSLKQTYLNYIIQKDVLDKDLDASPIFKGHEAHKTIEDVVAERFQAYIGKTGEEIMAMLELKPGRKSKNFKRLLVNAILTGSGSNKIEEFEKANITLKVIALEHTGALKESISFPAFDYKDLVTQVWYDEKSGRMSDFYTQLETKKFLFVVFRKREASDDVVLEKTRFWNFPMQDLAEAERVFDKTIDCINEGRYDDLPRISESPVAHVRPHGKDSTDTIETPQHTQQTKRCFWLNAKYIQKALELDQI